MAYDTIFIVKYHDIEQELLAKFKTTNDDKSNDDNSIKYDEQDILDICNKLYRDELQTVLISQEDFDTTKLNAALTVLLEIMLKDADFNELLSNMGQRVLDGTLSSDHNADSEKNIKYYIFTILFSQQLFYITHKIVCQYLTNNKISSELLTTLKHTSGPIIEEIIGFM